MFTTLTRLDAEWSELVATSGRAVAGWARDCPAVAPAADLQQLLDRISDRPDELLGALIGWGRQGESLAWRVVLQAMLGMVATSCRACPDRFDEAVSELWLAIAEYPLERRPRSIAANLAWTIRRWLATTSQTQVCTQGVLPAATDPGPDAEDTLATARRLKLIDTDTHRTLWLVYVAGLTSARVAAELGTTPELVRYRCSHTLHRLAGQAEALSA